MIGSNGRMRAILAALGVVCGSFAAHTAAAQCAMCREGANSASLPTQAALNTAIIGLALTPYLITAAAILALFPQLRAQLRSFLRRLFRRPLDTHA